MTWARGAKVGDSVEVRPLAEIMTTLDESCALDAMPFMPEMAQYVGRRFQIVKSAHKTCDPTGSPGLRHVSDAVHLETRCDGSTHDGCEARCLLFWKRAWLRPASGPVTDEKPIQRGPDGDLGRLQASTRKATDFGELRYRCQATEILAASTTLPISDLRQYLEDVSTRNVSLAQLIQESVRCYANAIIRRALRIVGIGRARPSRRTPTVPAARDVKKLALRPGEFVQVRPANEILATLNVNRKNRGLSFEPEMLRHCGKTYRVFARINRIIDEKSGEMIKLRNDCIALEGLTCRGLGSPRRIFCARSAFFYWREAWLQRTNDPAGGAQR